MQPVRRDANTLKAALAEVDRQHLRRTAAHDRSVSRAETVAPKSSWMAGASSTSAATTTSGSRGTRHIAAAMGECAALAGGGSGAAHLVTGHGVEHQRLEEELAEFTGRERALLFSTGYMANLAAIATLADRGEVVALDRLNHASLIDGTLLSGARFSRYAHGDPRRRRARAQGAQRASAPCSRPTACSAWMATSRACRRWRASRARTRRGSSSTTRTASACSAPPGRGLVEHFELGSTRGAGARRHARQGVRHFRRIRRRLQRI